MRVIIIKQNTTLDAGASWVRKLSYPSMYTRSFFLLAQSRYTWTSSVAIAKIQDLKNPIGCDVVDSNQHDKSSVVSIHQRGDE